MAHVKQLNINQRYRTFEALGFSFGISSATMYSLPSSSFSFQPLSVQQALRSLKIYTYIILKHVKRQGRLGI